MRNRKQVSVRMDDREVGILAETKNHLTAFEYSDEWLASGYSISPLSLPLRREVFVAPRYDLFEGLFGVFNDSLPDGWGRLLVDRFLMKNGIRVTEVNALTRLAIVGNSGMGALEYRPVEHMQMEMSAMSLDELALECGKIFEKEESEHLDDLFCMGGSSGGARPKIFYEIEGEEWIVKFPSSMDHANIGRQEYEYSVCAKKCGLSMADTLLLPSGVCDGFFATKRFDRENGRKIHMVSAGGLLETSHRIPNLDYNILMQLTLKMTHNYEDIEKMFRLMCFNVFAHNRDDHAKNFSYLCKEGRWQLSPAYDLTYSNSIGGEHATMVNGNGRNPDMDDILEVAKNVNLDIRKARIIGEEIKEIVQVDLREFLE